MRTLLLSCFILGLSSAQVFAGHLSSRLEYYPQDFYDRVEAGESGQPLKDDLYQILSMDHVMTNGQHDQLAKSCKAPNKCARHISLGYTLARKIMFGYLHLRETPPGSYSIRDVYCQRTVGRGDFTSRPPGPNQIPDPAVLNAEHTWPQSRFSGRFSTDLQKSDLHILFPVLSNANSSRGNIEFGDVVTELSAPCPQSSRGYSSDGTKRVVFEVPDDHKGNVARAIFYFSTRYQLKVSPGQESSLRAWHRLDPVDDAERARNAKIFSNQYDRNPFIDHPELVELISDF